MARVVIAGGGSLGTALATRLQAAHEVRVAKAELTSLPETEVQLAGAEVVVHVTRTRAPVARLPRAETRDVDALIADTVARAAKLVGAKHLVHFANAPSDERTSLLERSGVPLSVLHGGGADPVEALVELVNGAPGTKKELAAWVPAPSDSTRAPRFTTCSVQRYRRPKGMKALDLARAYFEWLPSDTPLVRTREREGVFTLFAAGVPSLVLRHVPGRSDDDIAWLEIADGALRGDASQGRFEFRNLLDGVTSMAVLIDFQPALPFPLYRFSQAIAHERSMRHFGGVLESRA